MAKRTLTIKTNVGDFDRATDSQYTHAVVRTSKRASAVFEAVKAGTYRGRACGVDARWVKDRGYAVTWHSSVQAADAAIKSGYKWDKETTLVGVFEVIVDDGWEPVSAEESERTEAAELDRVRAAGQTSLHRRIKG